MLPSLPAWPSSSPKFQEPQKGCHGQWKPQSWLHQLLPASKSLWPEVCEAGWHQLQASHAESLNKMPYALQSPWQAGLCVGAVCTGWRVRAEQCLQPLRRASPTCFQCYPCSLTRFFAWCQATQQWVEEEGSDSLQQGLGSWNTTWAPQPLTVSIGQAVYWAALELSVFCPLKYSPAGMLETGCLLSLSQTTPNSHLTWPQREPQNATHLNKNTSSRVLSSFPVPHGPSRYLHVIPAIRSHS